MTVNPYSAPGSSFKDTAEGALPPRPLALLLLQIGMVIVIILASISLLVAFTLTAYMTVVLVLVWSIAVLSAAALRSPMLRWLGGSALLLLIAGTATLTVAALDRPRAWTLPVGGLFLAGEIYWLYAIAFSAKAKRYLGVA